MANTATLHNLRVTLSDSDRGVYESFELRIARHPSEGLPYMLTRVLAYCLFWEADIAFSKGQSEPDEPDEPALWVRSLDGRVKPCTLPSDFRSRRPSHREPRQCSLGPLTLPVPNLSPADTRAVGSANHSTVLLGRRVLPAATRQGRLTSNSIARTGLQVDPHPLSLLARPHHLQRVCLLHDLATARLHASAVSSQFYRSVLTGRLRA